MSRDVNHSLSRLPNCLRKYRKAQGLKQKDVAKIFGMKSTSRISRWEKGKSIPSFYYVIRLSLLYHVFVEALFIDHVRYLKNEIQEKYQEVIKSNNHSHA